MITTLQCWQRAAWRLPPSCCSVLPGLLQGQPWLQPLAAMHTAPPSVVNVQVGSRQVQVAERPLPDIPMSAAEQDALDKATELVRMLADAGHYSLLVGGWVRDKFLQRPAADIDIATSALPQTVRSLPGVTRVLDLPRSVVKVLWAGQWWEVATFRGLVRAPGLAAAAADADMRDFSANALMYDPLRRVVLDAVGGVEDLAARRLRLLSEQRIREDPVRILRGIRFAVLLGLRMDAATAAVLRARAASCSPEAGLPPRRIWLELRKLAAAEASAPGTAWARALGLAAHLGVLPALFPWLRAKEAAVTAQAVRVAGCFPGAALPLELRVAATVHPSSGAAAYQQVLQYFPLPEQQERILALSSAASLVAAQQEAALGAWHALYARPDWPQLLDILAAWMPAQLQDSFRQYHQALYAQWQAAAHQTSLSQPPSVAGAGADAAAPSTGAARDDDGSRRQHQEEEVAAQQLYLQAQSEGDDSSSEEQLQAPPQEQAPSKDAK